MASRLKRPRQDPVSCELCRTKKLKCNREHPCSNCQARGVTCTLGNAIIPAPRGTISADTTIILSRLDRLEGLLLNNPSVYRKSSSTHTSPISTFESPNSQYQGKAVAKVAHEEALRIEGEQLYSTATHEKSALFQDSYNIHVKVCLTKEIVAKAKTPVKGAFGSALTPGRMFLLPPKFEALTLLNDFKTDIEVTHHVVYCPKAMKVLENVYSKLDTPNEIEISHLGLLFAIFGSVACYRTVQTKSLSLFQSDEDAVEVCKIWVRHGYDALEISRRTGAGTLEDVETATALCFVVFNLEGFSMRARSLHGAALTVARDLGLHKIDSPDRRPVLGKDGVVMTEIKRRLWWHVASTDWLLSISGGPQEGCYLVHTRHMHVNRPRNVTDEDLEKEGPDFNRPISEPTQMSYFLQRIRSAELARDIADAWPLGTSDVESVDYNQIIEVDAKFEDFFKDMPVFFRGDPESVRQSYHILKKWPGMAVQKTLINLSIHMRRCKLHQPFLVRGSSDERFRYSREACLQSAREVIEAKRRLDKEGGTFGKRRVPLNLFVVHHLFVAIIVLVMDLCFNRIPGEESERRDEVVRACRTLDSARGSSPLADRFLKSLTVVLARHGVKLTGAENTASDDGGVAPKSEQTNGSTVNGLQHHPPPPQQQQQQQHQQQQHQQHQHQQQQQQQQQYQEQNQHQQHQQHQQQQLQQQHQHQQHQHQQQQYQEQNQHQQHQQHHHHPHHQEQQLTPDERAGWTATTIAHLNPQGFPIPGQDGTAAFAYTPTPPIESVNYADPMAATNLELDSIWQSYVEQGAALDATNWDQLFSALEDPASLGNGWAGVPVLKPGTL